MIRRTTCCLVTVTALCSFTMQATALDLSNTDQRLICTELGLTPEAIAAFGFNSVQTNAMFDRLDELESQVVSLRSLQEQLQLNMAELKRTQRSVRVAESPTDATAMQTQIELLQSNKLTLESNIESLQDQIRSWILPVSINATTLEWVCEPTGLAAFLPVEFRFVNLVESDYIDLLPELTIEQQAIANGEQVDTDTQLILSRYRNLPAVQAARSNMLYNLDAVRGAYYN